MLFSGGGKVEPMHVRKRRAFVKLLKHTKFARAFVRNHFSAIYVKRVLETRCI
jgi:hypothetical protein